MQPYDVTVEVTIACSFTNIEASSEEAAAEIAESYIRDGELGASEFVHMEPADVTPSQDEGIL